MSVSPAAAPPVTRTRVVTCARQWLGTPYHHQASCMGVGADCLGLVRGVFADLYGVLPEAAPPYTRDWAEALETETLLEAATRHLVRTVKQAPETGDVIVFRHRRDLPAKHIAIATGPQSFIHAMEGHPVSEPALVPWWQRRIAAIFEFPGVQN